MSDVTGSVQEIADAAWCYTAARNAVREAGPQHDELAQALVDARLHDLTIVCGFPCNCDPDTCPGIIGTP